MRRRRNKKRTSPPFYFNDGRGLSLYSLEFTVNIRNPAFPYIKKEIAVHSV